MGLVIRIDHHQQERRLELDTSKAKPMPSLTPNSSPFGVMSEEEPMQLGSTCLSAQEQTCHRTWDFFVLLPQESYTLAPHVRRTPEPKVIGLLLTPQRD